MLLFLLENGINVLFSFLFIYLFILVNLVTKQLFVSCYVRYLIHLFIYLFYLQSKAQFIRMDKAGRIPLSSVFLP